MQQTLVSIEKKPISTQQNIIYIIYVTIQYTNTLLVNKRCFIHFKQVHLTHSKTIYV